MEISKRVYGLLKTTFSPQNEDAPSSSNSSNVDSASSTPRARVLHKTQSSPAGGNGIIAQNGSFIHHYLNGGLKKRDHPQVYYGKTGVDLPKLFLEPFGSKVYAAHTGPDGGLTEVPSIRKEQVTTAAIANLDDEFDHFEDTDSICSASAADIGALRMGECINGSKRSSGDEIEFEFDSSLVDYNRPADRACGASTSLYEHPPTMKTRSGEPVADCFGIVARRNHCIMALADGVNWGSRARLAAQCAIRGALEHLQMHMQGSASPANTQELFHILLAAFHAGHQLILQEGGLLTTLCVAVVCKLKDSACWVICACNVGDSLCFVNAHQGGTRELTLGSHDITSMRDMRDAGGALGPVDGVNPELHNLTCSMTFVDEDDIVFITSDGVSDNFDPVVGRFCVIESSPQNTPLHNGAISQPVEYKNGISMVRPSSLPVVSAHQRHELMLLRMDDLLNYGVSDSDTRATSAKQLVDKLIDFATQLTKAKRAFLEDGDLYVSKEAQKRIQTQVKQRLSELPGKLDHATVVAYQVGIWPNADDEIATPTDEEVLTPQRLPIRDHCPSDCNDNSVSEMSEIVQMCTMPADATARVDALVQKPFSPGSMETSILMMDDGVSLTSSVYAKFKTLPCPYSRETISCELKSPSTNGDECILVITQEEQASTSCTIPDCSSARIEVDITQNSCEYLERTVVNRRPTERAEATIPIIPSAYAKTTRTQSLASTSMSPPTTLEVTHDTTITKDSSSKRKKHARGSDGRHTLSVDIEWLKRLVPLKRDSVDDEENRIRRQSPLYSSGGKKWRSKLRLPWSKTDRQLTLASTPEGDLEDDEAIPTGTFPRPPKARLDNNQ